MKRLTRVVVLASRKVRERERHCDMGEPMEVTLAKIAREMPRIFAGGNQLAPLKKMHREPVLPIQPPENSTEESEDAGRVRMSEDQAAQQEIEMVPVGFAHGGGRIVCREHGLFDDAGEEIEIAG